MDAPAGRARGALLQLHDRGRRAGDPHGDHRFAGRRPAGPSALEKRRNPHPGDLADRTGSGAWSARLGHAGPDRPGDPLRPSGDVVHDPSRPHRRGRGGLRQRLARADDGHLCRCDRPAGPDFLVAAQRRGFRHCPDFHRPGAARRADQWTVHLRTERADHPADHRLARSDLGFGAIRTGRRHGFELGEMCARIAPGRDRGGLGRARAAMQTGTAEKW